MTDSIPANKSRSKVKPLQDKIQNLKYENKELLEELYEAGIKTRPTIMSQIEEKEAETLKSIEFRISECEKETGRNFPHYLAEYIKKSDLY